MKRVLAALAIVATLLMACGSDSDDDTATDDTSTEDTAEQETSPDSDEDLFPLTITDAAGIEHTFDEPPKIGCAWAGCRENLADLGVVSHAEGFIDQGGPDEFAYPHGQPTNTIEDTTNPEQWAATEVDIIIMRVPESPDNAAIEQAAPIFYLHHPSYGDSSATGLDAYYENLRILGDLTGRPDAAQEAIDRFDATGAALQAAAPEGAADLEVAFIFGNITDSYYVTGTENPFCAALATFELGSCTDAETAEMNGEAFLALDPDWIGVMVTPDMEGGSDRDDPVWERLTAVEEGHVYEGENRMYCCSLRGLVHAMQQYGHFVFGDEGGIPDPGLLVEFDPTTEAVR